MSFESKMSFSLGSEGGIQMIEKGTEVVFRGEKRRVTGYIRNTEGKLVLLWESSNSEGACMFSVWMDWTQGEQRRTQAKKKTS